MDDGDLTALLARLDERTERTEETLEKISHVLLEGNGTPAITVQVATLNAKVSSIEEHIRENRVPRHVWVAIIASIAVAIVSMLVTIKAA